MAEPVSETLMARLEGVLKRLEALLPAPPAAPDWNAAVAWRWRSGGLHPILKPHAVRLTDLRAMDEQRDRVTENTRRFVQGRPANNVLLTGARGTGKSSLVKAQLTEFADQGLRLLEMDRDHLVDLPELLEWVSGRPERFILFCDDLSFEAGESGYKALKSLLEGSVAAPSDNLLVYATSNRRHLMPEFLSENRDTRHENGEIHPGESTEEKISLSDRFGLWISFYSFDQEDYLTIAAHWVDVLGGQPGDPELFRREALQWALSRSSRSGRSAWHFARDWVGRQAP